MKQHIFRKPLSEEGEHAANQPVDVPEFCPEYAYLYLLTFKNFRWIKERRKKVVGSANSEFKHLNFIVAAGNKLEPRAICPCCRKNKVQFFSFKDGKFTPCCGSNKCKCRCNDNGKLYPFRLEVFEQHVFQPSAVRDQLENFLKCELGLPAKMSPIDVHTFLKKVAERHS